MARRDFDLNDFYAREFDEHAETLHACKDAVQSVFGDILAACHQSIVAGHKILFFGNGGSAADAQHLATELAVRYKRDRDPIAALALTTDTSLLTAAGNDLGFDDIFSRQIEALGQPGDVALGISTSGKSPNILNAMKQARARGLITVGFTGKTGGALAPLCDHVLMVPSEVTARIQEMHIMLGQMLCGALELSLGLVDQE